VTHGEIHVQVDVDAVVESEQTRREEQPLIVDGIIQYRSRVGHTIRKMIDIIDDHDDWCALCDGIEDSAAYSPLPYHCGEIIEHEWLYGGVIWGYKSSKLPVTSSATSWPDPFGG